MAASHPVLPYLALPYPPAFLYLHHPHHPATQAIPEAASISPDCLVVRVNTVEYFNLRLLLSGLLCKAVSGLGQNDEDIEVADWDAFRRGLDGAFRIAGQGEKANGKGKAKAQNGDVEMSEEGSETAEPKKLVIFIERAERLKAVLGTHWHVISRLGELVSCLRLPC